MGPEEACGVLAARHDPVGTGGGRPMWGISGQNALDSIKVGTVFADIGVW